jgi:erythromycin esterase
MIGDARIVALGEATHGTHEFFTLKHRMVEFLVQEMGFTVFAMETNWPETERLNRYVQTGEGDPAELLAGLHFWTWNTQEVLDLVEWLRSYNQNPANSPKVRFAGFDAQAMELAVDNTLAYLRAVAPEDADLAATRYACLDDFHLLGPEPAFLDYGQRPFSETQPCGDRVRAVYDDLVQNQSQYTALSSEETYHFAVRNALTVVQAEAIAALRYTDGPNPRDRYMAQNVSWLLEQDSPDARIILWAHNLHVNPGTSNMGGHLEREYGEGYLTFGFSFDRGSFNARELSVVDNEPQSGELTTFEVGPAPDGTFESYFRRAGMPAFVLDVRAIDYAEPGAKWLRSRHYLRSIGAAYDPSRSEMFFVSATLETTFDFVVFVEETTPSHLLPPFPSDRPKPT